ncbi:hypothetical protein [Lysobacter gummosus]
MLMRSVYPTAGRALLPSRREPRRAPADRSSARRLPSAPTRQAWT